MALVTAQQLGISMSDMEDRLDALMLLLPDLGENSISCVWMCSSGPVMRWRCSQCKDQSLSCHYIKHVVSECRPHGPSHPAANSFRLAIGL